MQCSARLLLADLQMPISDIAFELGFKDSGYFSAVFRKREGISPRDYRQNKIKNKHFLKIHISVKDLFCFLRTSEFPRIIQVFVLNAHILKLFEHFLKVLLSWRI